MDPVLTENFKSIYNPLTLPMLQVQVYTYFKNKLMDMYNNIILIFKCKCINSKYILEYNEIEILFVDGVHTVVLKK